MTRTWTRLAAPTALAIWTLTVSATAVAMPPASLEGVWRIERVGAGPVVLRLQAAPQSADAPDWGDRYRGEAVEGARARYEVNVVTGGRRTLVTIRERRVGRRGEVLEAIYTGLLSLEGVDGTYFDSDGRTGGFALERVATQRPRQRVSARRGQAQSPRTPPQHGHRGPPPAEPLPLPAVQGAPIAPHPARLPQPPPSAAPPPPSCQEVLIAMKHHPSHLARCKGVERDCAVTLLRAKHHPSHLAQCKPGLAPQCVQTLVAMGHHPSHLVQCRGVDDSCAVALLQAKHHPSHLRQCR